VRNGLMRSMTTAVDADADFEAKFGHMQVVHWFPGHMAKVSVSLHSAPPCA
jgi:hypothetical protein